MSWFNKTPEEKIIEEIRKENERNKRKEMINNGMNFLNNNKDVIIGAAALITGCVGFVCKTVSTITRYQTVNTELKRRHQVYDRSTGTYIDLRRKLNSKDYEKIEQLKGKGMKTGEALRKLNLIK